MSYWCLLLGVRGHLRLALVQSGHSEAAEDVVRSSATATTDGHATPSTRSNVAIITPAPWRAGGPIRIIIWLSTVSRRREEARVRAQPVRVPSGSGIRGGLG